MKVGVFFFIVLISPVIAGAYGILHDQFTVSISEEYFTKFKFIQFGIIDGYQNTEFSKRLLTSYVGFMATWWTGFPIGIILGFTGLMQKNWIQMFRISFKSILVALIITLATGLIGLAYGYFYLSGTEVNWYFPEGLIDKKSFITVGSMHNFSYLGGLFGLIGAVGYQIRQRKKMLNYEL